MPQIFFPTEPWAIGVEVAILTYLFQPGRITTIGGAYTFEVHAALAGLTYYVYNTFVHDMIGKSL